jgi:xanthine dehydrogenase accessory factor
MRDFFQYLHHSLQEGPVALATVIAARGSTPRVAGARMFLPERGAAVGTIGGGMTEGRVLALARETLDDGATRLLEADLRGRPGAIRDGICGGTMTLWISRLTRDNAGREVAAVLTALREGKAITTSTRFEPEKPLRIGAGAPGPEAAFVETLEPNPHLLVVGAGHIGRCLAALAANLGFEISVQDERDEWRTEPAFPPGCRLASSLDEAVATLRDWEGGRFAALVTRGFPQDLEALNLLSREKSLTYVGLLGSRKRVQTVLTAHAAGGAPAFEPGILHAPVGLEIGAETPEEIAVSLMAEMILVRRRGNRPAPPREADAN